MIRLHVHVIALRGTTPEAPAPRPARDLLPWADPYIAALIRRLTREIEAGPAPGQLLEEPADGAEALLAGDAFVPPLEPPVACWPSVPDDPPAEELPSAAECTRQPR